MTAGSQRGRARPFFRAFVFVASLQPAQQLRLIERADAPMTAGSQRGRARPFFRAFVFCRFAPTRSTARLIERVDALMTAGFAAWSGSPFLGDWANLTNLIYRFASYRQGW